MTRVKMNTKGFTLMEVLISIAIVGLLFAPMLSFFSHSARLNVNAKNKQRENTMAQSVMEEVRSYDSIADMAAIYQDTNNADLVRTTSNFSTVCTDEIVADDGSFVNNKYYFVHKNLESDGKKYTAKITVDTEGESGKYKKVNDEELPVISSLGSGSTVMAAEDDQTLNTLYDYQSRYHKATGNEVSLTELAGHLQKKIKIKITDKSKNGVDVLNDMVHVKIYNEYSMGGSYAGCNENILSDPLYNEEVVYKKLKGIYLFYNYDVYGSTNIFQGVDVDVEYVNHSDWICDYTLYTVCQRIFNGENLKSIEDTDTDKAMTNYANMYGSKTLITKNIKIGGTDHSANKNYIPVFSNFAYTLSAGGSSEHKNAEDMDSIIKTEKVQRLSEVTVQIYDSEGEMCVELKSTRGE